MDELFDFSDALTLAKEGWVIGNKDWMQYQTMRVHYPKHFQTINNPYAYLKIKEEIYSWTPDQKDLMSESYFKVEFSTQDFQ